MKKPLHLPNGGLTAISPGIAMKNASEGDEMEKPVAKRLDGTFIQIQSWMMKFEANDWHRELEAMRRAKIQLIIIQCLEFGSQRYISDDDRAVDPTERILQYADEHDWDVIVGLRTDQGWWGWREDKGYLKNAAEKSKKLATEVWQRYGRHPSLTGWYFPDECDDLEITDEQIDRLRAYFGDMSNHCKALSGGKLITFAPFYSGSMKMDRLRSVYTSLLDGAGIDVMMLQDGVGARGWDKQLEKKIVPYFRMFEKVCDSSHVELWCDLESFTQESESTDVARISRQLRAVAPYVRRIVTFDFFHYMSPYRGPKQEQLYRKYIRKFVDQEPSTQEIM